MKETRLKKIKTERIENSYRYLLYLLKKGVESRLFQLTSI